MNQSFKNVHPNAKIAKDVVIESFSTIYEDVEIGEGTWIGPNVTIMDGARIGKNCSIFPGAVISAIPQDLKFNGEKSTAVVGDDTIIRECVTINRGTKAKDRTIVGSNCLIQCYVHIAHDCIIGDSCIMGAYAGTAGEVEVDDFAIISPGSLVHQFVRVGPHVMIQGLCKVTKDVPPYSLAGREPLSFTGINSIGLRRRNFKNESIYEIQEIYRIIYQKGMNISDAVSYIEANLPATDERDNIILFIRNSKRGIVRGYFDEKD